MGQAQASTQRGGWASQRTVIPGRLPLLVQGYSRSLPSGPEHRETGPLLERKIMTGSFEELSEGLHLLRGQFSSTCHTF